MSDKDIYKLRLHETIHLGGDCIIRVPGGWIYELSSDGSHVKSSVFVPFNNEFQKRSL